MAFAIDLDEGRESRSGNDKSQGQLCARKLNAKVDTLLRVPYVEVAPLSVTFYNLVCLLQ